MLLVAIVAVVWTPYDPLQLNFRAKLAAPSAAHWLGTDEFGRDVASRLMAGAATSVWISLMTVALAVVLGTVIGVFTGFVRGWFDRIIMAFNDALLAFPGILLALGLLAVVGANKYGIILALGLAYTPVGRAHRARHGAVAARTRVHRRLARDGQLRALHHGPPRPAELPSRR